MRPATTWFKLQAMSLSSHGHGASGRAGASERSELERTRNESAFDPFEARVLEFQARLERLQRDLRDLRAELEALCA